MDLMKVNNIFHISPQLCLAMMSVNACMSICFSLFGIVNSGTYARNIHVHAHTHTYVHMYVCMSIILCANLLGHELVYIYTYMEM